MFNMPILLANAQAIASFEPDVVTPMHHLSDAAQRPASPAASEIQPKDPFATAAQVAQLFNP
jgi:hypothetical protein